MDGIYIVDHIVYHIVCHHSPVCVMCHHSTVCVILCNHSTACVIIVPYSGLFSLGANFPEFPEWAHDSGKFMLGYL